MGSTGVPAGGFVLGTYSLKTSNCWLGCIGCRGSSAPAQLVGGNVDLVRLVGDADRLAGLQGGADEPAGEGGRLEAGGPITRAVQAEEDEAGQLCALNVLPDVSFLQPAGGETGFRVGWNPQSLGGWIQWDPSLTSSCSTGSVPLITHDM